MSSPFPVQGEARPPGNIGTAPEIVTSLESTDEIVDGGADPRRSGVGGTILGRNIHGESIDGRLVKQ